MNKIGRIMEYKDEKYIFEKTSKYLQIWNIKI